MRHLLNPLDFSVEEIDDLLALARDIEQNLPGYAHVCDGKKLATLFYEPSTRTRLSFEAAMLNLGGNVLGFSSANSSSAAKGESVADTIRMISCYADICAMRHPKGRPSASYCIRHSPQSQSPLALPASVPHRTSSSAAYLSDPPLHAAPENDLLPVLDGIQHQGRCRWF